MSLSSIGSGSTGSGVAQRYLNFRSRRSDGSLDGRHSLAQTVLKTFLATVPGQIAALAKAVNDNDAVTARRTAHSIKGAAANVGGQELSNAARRAENLGAAGDLKSVAALLSELENELERLRPELITFCE